MTTAVTDPRTGEIINAAISYNDLLGALEQNIQKLDVYLQSIGASYGLGNPWPDPGPCKDGQTKPMATDLGTTTHNTSSTVFQKMQQYLQMPTAVYGNLGPQDFVAKQDDDFFHAYYALIPYQIFADPNANPYVTPEGQSGVWGPAACGIASTRSANSSRWRRRSITARSLRRHRHRRPAERDRPSSTSHAI